MSKNIFKKEVERQRAELRRSNKNFPVDHLIPVPLPPDDGVVKNRIAAFRSHDYLVQVFQEEGGLIRLSVNRSGVNKAGDWLDGISWDSLQIIKSQCGFGDCDGVEVYPPNKDVVCDFNIRHLWIFPPKSPLPFVWRKKEQPNEQPDTGATLETNGDKIVSLDSPSQQDDQGKQKDATGDQRRPEPAPDALPKLQDDLNTLRNLRQL